MRPSKQVAFVLYFLLFFSLILIIRSFGGRPKLSRASPFLSDELVIIPSSRYGERKIYSSRAALELPKTGIFCFVVTPATAFSTKVPMIRMSWLSKFDNGQFFTSEKIGNDSIIPYATVYKGFSDNEKDEFHKTIEGFYFAYANVSQDFDWYFRADPDLYVNVDNLRKYVDSLNPDLPFYLGYKHKPFLKQGFNTGKAGYVLSRGAVRLLIESSYPDLNKCPFKNNLEDLGLAKCLQSVGITPTSDVTETGKHRFLPFNLGDIMSSNFLDKTYSIFPESVGDEVLSAEMITIRNLTRDEFHLVDVMLDIARMGVL